MASMTDRHPQGTEAWPSAKNADNGLQIVIKAGVSSGCSTPDCTPTTTQPANTPSLLGTEPCSAVPLGDAESHPTRLTCTSPLLPLETWLAAEPARPRRATLPPPGQPAPRNVNVWGLVKDFVGTGELSRVATPVQFLEPLSELQQRCEDMEFSQLLDQAAEAPAHSLERLLLVAAFTVSAYSGVKRTQKPFNALLGETYELACPEKGFRFLAEKVQDAPTTINHVHAEGRRWVFDLEDELHTRFTGTAIELAPKVLMQAAFHDGDVYQWHKAKTSINGVVTGRISLEHKGSYPVRCLATGLTAAMKLHASTMLTSRARMHEVSGEVLQRDGQAIKGVKLAGKWNEEVRVTMPDGSERLLWRVNPPAADPSRYQMTPWVLGLNEVTPDLARVLPPTDTRLRADIRALELGQYDQATVHHKRVLDSLVKASKGEGNAYKAAWFERIPGRSRVGEEYLFRYKGGYWEARAAGALAKAHIPLEL